MIQTVGILYPGEMGASLAQLLQMSGYRTITTTTGRSRRTAEQCRRGNITVLESLAQVVEESQMIISLVPPGAARDVAGECRRWMVGSGARLFVDANSISPLTARDIAALFDSRGVDFVDASIHGLASQLAERGTVFLSGPQAHLVAPCFAAARVVDLGDEVGRASMFKMLLAGMSKGIVALYTEMALAGHRSGMLDELLREYRIYYPGLMEAVDRLLPTYPRHARRRSDELGELAETMESLGLPAEMAEAARGTMVRLAELALDEHLPAVDADSQDAESVIRTICRQSSCDADEGRLSVQMR